MKKRIVETERGIQGEFSTQMYDRMMRRMRDKGWLETALILKFEIVSGHALEIGPGPGYLGLEWLKKTNDSDLVGLDISPDMVKIAERNAMEYGLQKRVKYVVSSAERMPFEDEFFDAVFSNGSLHEWSKPVQIFNEIYRILKKRGKYCISDLRRDMNPFIRCMMKLLTKPKEMKFGLSTSINAAYNVEEIEEILHKTKLRDFTIKKNIMGLVITGMRA